MVDKNAIFTMIFLLLPFIFSGILALFKFIKNRIHIRNISIFYFVLNLISSYIFINKSQETVFSLFNVDFIYDNTSSLIIFFIAFIYLILSIISKTFISHSYKIFYIILLTSCGITNLFALTDNIFFSLLLILWLIFINYTLYSIYANKQDKNNKKLLKKQLKWEIFYFIICVILINIDFSRYFILNQIDFLYSSIEEHFYHINDFSIILAFFGFILIVFKLFNMIIVSGKINSILSNYNKFINSTVIISNMIFGFIFMCKIYCIFSDYFYDFQNIIGTFVIINMLYCAFLSLKTEETNCYLYANLTSNISILILSLFSFEYKGFQAYIYGFIVLILSFLLISIILGILESKFKTTYLSEYKKIPTKCKSVKLFSAFSILVLAKMPISASFFSILVILFAIFSNSFDEIILQLVGYFIIFTIFLLVLSSLNLLNKVLVEPVEKYKFNLNLSKHQRLAVGLLMTTLILIIFSFQFICNQVNVI